MPQLRLLLDTNIIIPAEDPAVMPPQIVRMFEVLRRTGVDVVAHEVSRDDLSRDTDEARRSISLSKLQKYPLLPKALLSPAELNKKYGPIKSANDLADCYLLHSLVVGAADILVTSDTNLFRRAARVDPNLAVLSPTQVVELLEERYSSVEVAFRYIADVACEQLNFDDPIFLGLKTDYPNFQEWTRRISRAGRRAWIIRDGDSIAGLIIYKPEETHEVGFPLPGKKILKLATFKVSDDHRGGRLGELLLRQALWYAFSNKFDTVYLTAFQKQRSLIDLLEFFGFQEGGETETGEIILVKSWLSHIEGKDLCERHARSYPSLVLHVAEFLIVPIRSEYYERLFPEAARASVGESGFLFGDHWTGDQREHLAVSTAIRKVYVCNSRIQGVGRGSVLLFYFSKDVRMEFSQTLAACGVVERAHRYLFAGPLVAETAKRTVYTPAELTRMVDRGSAFALYFIFSGYLRRPVSLAKLEEQKIIAGPPQSLMHVRGEQAARLSTMLELAYAPETIL